MPQLQRSPLAASVAVVAALALAAACSSTSDAPTAAVRTADAHADHRAPAEATQGQLNAAERVREATARFADLEVAMAAGYSLQYPAGCADLPDGSAAQGFHFLNQSLVDTKTDLLQPELVMYEPQADGSMVLVGVDYIVPFSLWPADKPAPRLLGRPFLRNEGLQVWALHIWMPRENPDGLFAAWNPNVSCEHEAAYVP